MSKPIRVVQYGLGPIGRACARRLLEKSATGRLELVGAVDIHPELAGRDLADLLQLEASSGIIVSNDARAVLDQTHPDVVVHTTSSFLERVYDQIAGCLDAGASVISSTEELFYPFDRHPDLARSLHELARARRVTVMGTGVNPGFAMDMLALTASGVCEHVDRIRICRVVDAGLRREPLQRKVGAGLTVEQFEERRAGGQFGHIGLRESAAFVARGLEWEIGHVEESLECVVATERQNTPFLTVEAGQVAGIRHRVVAFRSAEPVLELDLHMFVGATETNDAVYIEGVPPVDLVIRGGIFGDTATVGALINAIPLVVHAAPGLRLSSELPVPRAFATAGGAT